MSQITPEHILGAAVDWLRDTWNADISEATTWAQLQQLGVDSLDQVELVMHIEDWCGCAIEDEWINELEKHPENSLKTMAEFIAAKRNM